MSYSLRTLADSPLGYWQLNSVTSPDLTTASVNPVMTNVTASNLSSPPLAAGSSYAMKVLSNTSIKINNSNSVYNSLTYASSQDTFAIELWFSFNNIFDGSGYIKNSQSSKSYYLNNKLNILKIKNSSTTFANILYDYQKNTFRFSFNGSKNQDAYYVPEKLNIIYHIVAIYQNGGLFLYVNGVPGISGYVTDQSQIPTTPSNLNFVIDGVDLNTANSFLISDLAFYNYMPSITQIRSKLIWANTNNKPVFSGISSGNPYTTFQSTEEHTGFMSYLSGDMFKKAEIVDNLIIDSRGIRPNYVDSLSYINGSSSVSYTASGSYWNDNGGLKISNFPSLLDYSKFTFSTQVYSPSVASSQYIFSISGFQDTNVIYLQSSSSNYTLCGYDNVSKSVTTLATLSTTPASGYKNIAISFDGNKTINLYTSDSGSASVDLSSFYSVYNFAANSSFYLGNSYHSNSSLSLTNNFYYKNLLFSKYYINDFSTYSFTSIQNFAAYLSSDLNVSSKGYWVKRIPIFSQSSYSILPIGSKYFDGSKITWDGMDNVSVEASIDGGATYYKIENNSNIPFYNYYEPPQDITLRIIMLSNYQLDNSVQRLNNLKISFYKNNSYPTQDAYYSVSPQSDSNFGHSYVTKTNNYQINARTKNLGLYFDNSIGYTDGYAKMSNVSGSGTYGIEFWFRPEQIVSGSNNYILSSETASSTGPKLYIDSSSSTFRTSASCTLYVNGGLVPDNTFTPVANEIYHICYNFGSAYSNNLYINGKSGDLHIKSSYGFLRTYKNPITSTIASAAYSSFIQPDTRIINDTIFSASSAKIVPNKTNDYAVAYKIG